MYTVTVPQHRIALCTMPFVLGCSPLLTTLVTAKHCRKGPVARIRPLPTTRSRIPRTRQVRHRVNALTFASKQSLLTNLGGSRPSPTCMHMCMCTRNTWAHMMVQRLEGSIQWSTFLYLQSWKLRAPGAMLNSPSCSQ